MCFPLPPRIVKAMLIARRFRESPEQVILIVEPVEVVRVGLSAMAESIPFVKSVFDSSDIQHATLLAQSQPINIMLISGSFTASATMALRCDAARRGIKIITVTWECGQLSFCTAETVGNGILLLENVTLDSLADAISSVTENRAVMSSSAFRAVVERSVGDGPCVPTIPSLTFRELQVLTRLAEGETNREIAEHISISEHSVKRHVISVMAKLNSPNRTHAVSCAIQLGIIENPSHSVDETSEDE